MEGKGCYVSGAPTVIRDLTKQRRRRQQQRQKAIGLVGKTTILHVRHAFFVHFFVVPTRLRREMTKF